jgi:hypothetical protein
MYKQRVQMLITRDNHCKMDSLNSEVAFLWKYLYHINGKLNEITLFWQLNDDFKMIKDRFLTKLTSGCLIIRDGGMGLASQFPGF